MMFLIPNLGGGLRPIWLLGGVVRVWEKLRKPYLDAWESEFRRHYNWSAAGRSAQRCVFEQAIADEYAQGWTTSCNILLDLVKAFEKVCHSHLAQEALVYNFPLALLRVIVSQFAGVRRIVYDCVYSEAVVTDFAIIAGSRFGPGLLRLSITSPLDKWTAA